MDGAYGLARDLVAECEEMGEIVLAESSIVTPESADALFPLRGILPDETLRISQVLDLAAVLPPFLLHLFQVADCWHGSIIIKMLVNSFFP